MATKAIPKTNNILLAEYYRVSERKYNPEMTALMIRRWCDKAERAHADVRKKLMSWKVPASERETLIGMLIEMNLVNEERFASAFAHDKFEFNQWGRLKIEHALRKKGVSERNIIQALKHIPKENQTAAIQDLIRKRLPKLKGKTDYHKKASLARYLMSKGFESDAIWSELNKIEFPKN